MKRSCGLFSNREKRLFIVKFIIYLLSDVSCIATKYSLFRKSLKVSYNIKIEDAYWTIFASMCTPSLANYRTTSGWEFILGNINVNPIDRRLLLYVYVMETLIYFKRCNFLSLSKSNLSNSYLLSFLKWLPIVGWRNKKYLFLFSYQFLYWNFSEYCFS